MTTFDSVKEFVGRIYSKDTLIFSGIAILLLCFLGLVFGKYDGNGNPKNSQQDSIKSFNVQLWYFGKLLYAATISFTEKQQEDFFNLLRRKGGLDYLEHDFATLMYSRNFTPYQDPKSQSWKSLSFEDHIAKHRDLVLIAGIKREMHNSLYSTFFKISNEMSFSTKIYTNDLSVLRIECSVSKNISDKV